MSSSQPRHFQDLRGLEQTVPPRVQRTPSPAPREERSGRSGMAEPASRPRHGLRTPSPSPPSSFVLQPVKYSAWENRGHRSDRQQEQPQQPSQQQQQRQYSLFPRERSERSVSPRHNFRPEASERCRSPPPALEPAPLEIRSKKGRPLLQPSDAELRRELEQQEQQRYQRRPSLSEQQRSPSSRGTSPLTSPEFVQHNTTPPISRKASMDLVSPLSSTSFSTSTPRSLTHSRKPSAGEINLAMIGAPRAPRAQKTPRKSVPSLCDYLSLDELEGLWAQQDLFVGSVSAPQGQRHGERYSGAAAAAAAAAAGDVCSLVPDTPIYFRPRYEDLGVYPALRLQPVSFGLVQ